MLHRVWLAIRPRCTRLVRCECTVLITSHSSGHYFVHAPCTQQPWPYLAPPVFYLLTFILAGVLCMAVTAMAGWHIFMIACGETSVESQDHEHYRKIARQRGEVSLPRPTTQRITDGSFQTFVNSYDMGYLKNLQLFFNVGPDG